MPGGPDTGNTATIVFGSSGFTACMTEIDSGEETLEALEDTCLSTTGQKTFIPSDLKERATTRIKYWFDTSANDIPLGTVETITITYPLGSGQATAANEAGTGFVVRRKKPVIRNGTLMEGEAEIRWDGKTECTYTKAVAS